MPSAFQTCSSKLPLVPPAFQSRRATSLRMKPEDVVEKDCATHPELLTPKDPFGEPAARLSKRMIAARAGAAERARAMTIGRARRKTTIRRVSCSENRAREKFGN